MSLFFLLPEAEKVIVMFPMIQGSNRYSSCYFLPAGTYRSKTCCWTSNWSSLLLVLFSSTRIQRVIYPRHVEGHRLEKTVWSLSTFQRICYLSCQGSRPCQTES